MQYPNLCNILSHLNSSLNGCTIIITLDNMRLGAALRSVGTTDIIEVPYQLGRAIKSVLQYSTIMDAEQQQQPESKEVNENLHVAASSEAIGSVKHPRDPSELNVYLSEEGDVLDLTGNQLKDLTDIPFPDTLTDVDLTTNRLSTIDPRICQLASLQKISFRQNLLTDDSIAELAHCQALTSLQVELTCVYWFPWRWAHMRVMLAEHRT